MLNNKFKRITDSGGGLSINYSYTDAASGTGYVVFYGFDGDNAELSTTNQTSLASERPHIPASNSNITLTTTPTKWLDKDFDITFNKPQNVKGKVYVNVPIGMQNKSAIGSISCHHYVVAKVYHYDGTTETLLGTGTSWDFSTFNLAQNGVFSNMALAIPNIASKTHFKKGETLRVTIEGYYYLNEGEADTPFACGIAANPQNVSDYDDFRVDVTTILYQVIETDEQTRLEIHVPFVVDI